MTTEEAIDCFKHPTQHWSGEKDEADRMAIEALENCPPKDSICYGCHDNCKKCECQQMLMI